MRIDVYVPTAGDHPMIDAGSGIVGTPTEGDRILVDYEGNRHGSTNIVTYADRVHHAAGRHQQRYPTIARAWLRASELTRVGVYDTDTGEVTLDSDGSAALVGAWCGVAPDQLSEQLLTAGSAHHQIRREVLRGLAAPDPATRFAARHMAKRYHIDV